jgi:molybdate transport system permease protein
MKGLHRLCFIALFLLALLVAGVLFALIFRLSFKELLDALSSAEVLFALRLSLLTSLGAIIIALILGLPSGYLLARRSFRGKAILDTLLDIPLVMTPLVAGVGLLFLFGQTFLGRHLAKVGINLIFSPWGAVLAQAFIASPIIARTCKSAFEEVSPRYEWAAQTLGLRPLRTFFRVTLPMARRGILSGIVLAWARAIGEFGATLMVAGSTRMKTETLPIAVFLNISSGEIGIALSCALILIAVGFIILLILKQIGNNHRPELPMKGIG